MRCGEQVSLKDSSSSKNFVKWKDLCIVHMLAFTPELCTLASQCCAPSFLFLGRSLLDSRARGHCRANVGNISPG